MRSSKRTHRTPTIFQVMLCVAMASVGATGAERVRFDKSRATPEDVKRVVQRLHDAISKRAASQEARKSRATGLDPQVDHLLAAQNTTEGDRLYGAFADVKLTDERHIDFGRGYFDPVRTLASAYSLPGSRHYHAEPIARAIHLAFVYTRKHVHPGCAKPGNWWVWAKQMPDCLCDLLALMHGHLQPDDRAYIVAVLDYLLGTGPIPGSYYHTGKAGKDALNVFKIGVLTGDATRIAHAWECMENEVSPFLLEPDGTPLMTVIKNEFLGISLPYVYEGYATVLEWARVARGTRLNLRPETTGKITRYLLDLGRWNTFRGTEVAWISFTSYRVFWRPASTLSYAARLADADVARADALRAMAAGKDTPPVGCRFWPSAETVIFRSPNHYAAVIMASKPKHKISWSYKNHFLNIGSRWYYGRDGHLVIARRPADLDPNLTYTLNWKRLTGVTRDDGSLLTSKQIHKEGTGYWQPGYAFCRSPMAGATTLDGEDGVAGIEVRSGDVRALKSYVFLKDRAMIVAMGSHIRGRGHTETIVHTVPIGKARSEIVVDGKRLTLTAGKTKRIGDPGWIHGLGGGYAFPDGGNVTAIVETREPDFTDNGNPPPDKRPDVPPQTFITIAFDHGNDPKDAAYACVYLPTAAVGDMPALAALCRSQMTHVRNETGHFVRFGPFAAAAFFKPGTLDGYTADRPCFLAIRQEHDATRLSVYEPSWQDCDLKLRLSASVPTGPLPDGVRVQNGELIIETRKGQPIECFLRRAQ